jgi:hypothetical protein
MGKLARILVISIVATTLAAGVRVKADEASPSGTAPSLDLLRRAVNPNPTLESYIASATLSATLHAAVPISKSFNGTAYYLRPKRRITFENVPGPLSKFRNLTSTTPTYEQAAAKYTITPMLDDGTISTYALVPKESGARVTKLVVSVDDKAALIVHAVWTYSGGGTLSFDQTYQAVGVFHVPDRDLISARFPGYHVDGTIRFSAYQPNAAVDPSIFEKNP